MIVSNGFDCIGKDDNCKACKHYHNNLEEGFSGDPVATCEAFPTAIPLDILTGKFNHENPYPDDNNIRYEPLGDISKTITKDPVSEQIQKSLIDKNI